MLVVCMEGDQIVKITTPTGDIYLHLMSRGSRRRLAIEAPRTLKVTRHRVIAERVSVQHKVTLADQAAAGTLITRSDGAPPGGTPSAA